MESTLDSIHAPGIPQEEMSYLFGRDPSILAYGQRPFPSKDTKKNLFSLYEIEESNSIGGENTSQHSVSLQTVKVYLRLKPFPKKLKLSEEQQEAYKIINSTTLITRLPILDNNTSSIKHSKSSEIISRRYTFSQTFGPETTQLELFEQTVQQQMIDFLTGHNCTIMTYGTTNSGKSYTLQGTTTSPGLIPRALEFVFSNITTRPNPSYKPLHYCDVINLNALERAQELEAKTKLLTFGSVDKHQYTDTYKQMQKLLREESVRPSQSHDAHYSIWISFAEIYNEIVYDLLSNGCQKKRMPLKVGTDSSGRAFIKGLKTVYVNSAAEAYQILMAGQYNLKIAATALNAKSSRSHCIFTITLLKYYTENSPDTVEVSTFSFCDLAGSERLKKTLNIGDRLREAQNINTSLLVLGRCLKSIHEGQLTRAKTDAIGPFRESKLTRLFQRALSGKEHLALIVNVNPLPNLYVETQNVLNFAAIAKRIVIEEKKQIQKKLTSRFSQIVTQSIETVTDWDTAELKDTADWQWANTVANSRYITAEGYTDLANENEKLKRENAVLKNSALIRDFQSRQEMAEKYIAMINDLEIDWKQRIDDMETLHEDALEWNMKQVKEFYEGKLSQLHKKKRRRTDCSDQSDEDMDCFNVTFKELSGENVQLRAKNEALKKALMELKITNETLIVEKNKVSFELGLSQEDLKVARNLLEAAEKDICCRQDGKVYAEEMSSQLFAKDKQIKKLKEILNEAKEEYITMTSDLRKRELCINDQEKIIVESEEKIEELEMHLEQVNICLIEKTRIAELLEEKLEQQSEKLSKTGDEVLQLQEEIEQLRNEKLALLECYQKPVTASTCVADFRRDSEDISASSEASQISDQAGYHEIIIKEDAIADDVLEKDITRGLQEGTKRADIGDTEARKFTETKMSVKETDVKADINELDPVQKKNSEENSELTRTSQTDVTCNKSSRVFTETGCQTDTKGDEIYCDVINGPEENNCHKSTQTTITTAEDQVEISHNKEPLKEETVQISEIDNKLQLQELVTCCNSLQAQYEQECSKVQRLTEELSNMEKTVQSLKEESHSNKSVIEDYRRTVQELGKQLLFATEGKQKIEEALLGSNIIAVEEITSSETEINKLEKDRSPMKDTARQYLEKLETAREELDNCRLKCNGEREVDACKSEGSIKEENDVSVKQLDIDIEEMRTDMETVAELKDNALHLSNKLEMCQIEKVRIQNALDENNKKLLELENRLEETILKEQEKDTEIVTLQKELKHMIQDIENSKKTDNLMEAELKGAISELAQTKEMLSQKEQYIKELKIHLENFERNTKILNLLEENAKERQAENERLRNMNDELRTNLVHKEGEMDAFMKNRDETMSKYEALVKNQQEELDRQKREVMRFQELFRRQMTPTPNKDDYKKLQNRIQELQDRLRKYEASVKDKDDYNAISEDEVLPECQPAKRRGKKAALSSKQEDIPVIELSGSESKRCTRHTAMPVSTEEKRATRTRKKLFLANDSFADIEPCEDVIPATPVPTRTLRSRKKTYETHC